MQNCESFAKIIHLNPTSNICKMADNEAINVKMKLMSAEVCTIFMTMWLWSQLYNWRHNFEPYAIEEIVVRAIFPPNWANTFSWVVWGCWWRLLAKHIDEEYRLNRDGVKGTCDSSFVNGGACCRQRRRAM